MLAIAILLLFPISSLASSYFTYITDLTVSGGRTKYFFTLDYWNAAENEPNPCVSVLGSVGARNCYFTINHFHSMSGGTVTGGVASRTAWDCRQNVASFTSMKQIRDYMVGQCGLSLPFKGFSEHNGAQTVDECIALFLTTSAKGGSGKILPGSICGIAPPPTGKCYFYTGQLTLNHGTFNSDANLNGNVKTGSFEILCNKDMNLMIRANSEDPLVKLRPDGSLVSEVKVNNRPLNIGALVSMKANTFNSVSISSTLKTKTNDPIMPGTFKGTVTLVLTIP